MNPAHTRGPDIVSLDFNGWWIYLVGPIVGATIALALISLVRGLPDQEEREAAEGGGLPLER
jgi:aquaporin Z